LTGVVDYVAVEVGVAAAEAGGVFAGPAAGLGVVVAGSEADQAGLVVVEAAGEAEGLKARVGVVDDAAEGVVVDPLGDQAVGSVHHQADAPQVIGEEAIGHPILDHIGGDGEAAAVDEEGGHVAGAVELGHRAQAVLVEVALDQHAVDFLAHPAVGSVDHVVDLQAVREQDRAQVTGEVVGVVDGLAVAALGGELAVGAVGIGVAAVGEQAVLVVVGGGAGAHWIGPGGPVAVGVVVVMLEGDVVLLDVGQASGRVVGVVVGRADATDRLDLLKDPAAAVAGEGFSEQAGAAVSEASASDLTAGCINQLSKKSPGPAQSRSPSDYGAPPV
jgi:hypothetical protein